MAPRDEPGRPVLTGGPLPSHEEADPCITTHGILVGCDSGQGIVVNAIIAMEHLVSGPRTDGEDNGVVELRLRHGRLYLIAKVCMMRRGEHPLTHGLIQGRSDDGFHECWTLPRQTAHAPRLGREKVALPRLVGLDVWSCVLFDLLEGFVGDEVADEDATILDQGVDCSIDIGWVRTW